MQLVVPYIRITSGPEDKCTVALVASIFVLLEHAIGDRAGEVRGDSSIEKFVWFGHHIGEQCVRIKVSWIQKSAVDYEGTWQTWPLTDMSTFKGRSKILNHEL